MDILLLTVEECEFLACYAYMRNSFKSYHKDLGFVFIGTIGEDENEPLQIALMKCFEGSSDPGGSQNVVKNAVVQLRPKVVYSVGCCIGLKQEKTQIGDVVISSKLTTESFRAPVGRDIANLVRGAAYGWKPPLEIPEAREIHVHCGGEILSGVDQDTAKQHQELYPSAYAVEMEGKGEKILFIIIIIFIIIFLLYKLCLKKRLIFVIPSLAAIKSRINYIHKSYTLIIH